MSVGRVSFSTSHSELNTLVVINTGDMKICIS